MPSERLPPAMIHSRPAVAFPFATTTSHATPRTAVAHLFQMTCALVLFAIAATAAAADSGRIIVKFRAGSDKALATASSRATKAATAAQVALRPVRTLAIGADVVALAQPVSEADTARVAARIAADPGVVYAEPDRPRYAQRTPNDPFVSTQTYFGNGPTGISALAAWDITTGSPSTVVAVLDTGIRPHGDLAGRLLAGYDMVSDPLVANDGDGRDSDPSDPGDFIVAADKAGILADCDVSNSSWHGTAVAGLVGANTDNGIWTAGIDWSTRILPVRVLGKCLGYDSDIVDGIAWASGLAVPGAPANTTPAQVINLSLGGASDTCPRSYQDAIDAAYAHGVTRAVVAAAGNASSDVSGFTPANCAGVIAVASVTSNGDLATYSNFGTGITLAAPGGQYSALAQSQRIYVLSNTGTTTPKNDTIGSGGGTSYAAPMVSGTVALMLAVVPELTPSQVRAALVGSVKGFVTGSTCHAGLCGPGLLDAAAAVRAAAGAGPTPSTVDVVEYYNAALDHYFITWRADEEANLDAGLTPTRWTRTGYTFKAYSTAQAGTSPVCRYYIPPGLGDSHFFGRGTAECIGTGVKNPTFVLESDAFMHVFLPAAGNCPAGTTPIYRVFSNRADANHRYMTDASVRDSMVVRGWLAEGDGPDRVVMCAPPG
jgi:serine protease